MSNRYSGRSWVWLLLGARKFFFWVFQLKNAYLLFTLYPSHKPIYHIQSCFQEQVKNNQGTCILLEIWNDMPFSNYDVPYGLTHLNTALVNCIQTFVMSSLSGTMHIPGGGSLYILIISLEKKQVNLVLTAWPRNFTRTFKDSQALLNIIPCK